MHIIFGLGNPGREYENTRHNAGFMFVDYLQKKYNLPDFKEEKKFKSLVSTGEIEDKKIILVKPQTFMNLSGEAVAALINFYKIDLDKVIICYDDIDLPLGTIRFREKGSAGTHNGMKSIIEKPGSENVPRLRLGVESRGVTAAKEQDTTSFVLGNFRNEEKRVLEGVLGEAGDLIIQKLGTSDDQA